jgi:hypothetical protein
VIGIVAGLAFGYLAARLIAHEKWAFLAEYAPIITLVAMIGACFAADGLQASGFMAVFGIVLGNKESWTPARGCWTAISGSLPKRPCDRGLADVMERPDFHLIFFWFRSTQHQRA